MVTDVKRVNYYRLALRRGTFYRMSLSEDDRLIGNGGGTFGYLAPGFDSEDMGASWHRLRLEGTFKDCKYEIIAAATDADLRDQMKEAASYSAQLALLKESSRVRMVNVDDMLLHRLTGRYLWVFLLVSGAKQDSAFCIEGFHVEFPQGSFVEYLPEIYQTGRDSFFERYMAVFQSIYEEMEQSIDALAEFLDYQTTPDDNVKILSGWTGDWASRLHLSPKKLRYVLQNLNHIQSGRGTRSVMEQMLKVTTGQKAIILEHFKWHDWMQKSSSQLESYEKLFGRSEDTFTVIIDLSREETTLSREEIIRLLQDYTPLGMHCNVVLLRSSSHMDTHCYLDKNSCLSTPIKADTGGMVLGGNYILS